jgi:C4-dicarboxylate anaerobic carrier
MTSRFPHPLTLLTAGIILASALTYLLPAGEYDRRPDPVTGRQVVVSGTFHRVPARPVGIFDALVAIPKGLAEAGSVVFLVFLVGGAFTVVDETGALRQAVDWLVRRMQRREVLMIPIVSVAFAAGGALENMSEEIIALVPVLLLVTRRLGFDALTAVAISIGAAGVGAAFSPINPFQAQIAQKLAGLPLLSGAGFRMILLVLALAVWIWGTWRHAVPHSYRTAGERCRRRGGAQRARRGHPRHRARDFCRLHVRRDAARVGFRSDVGALLRDGRGLRPHRGARHGRDGPVVRDRIRGDGVRLCSPINSGEGSPS